MSSRKRRASQPIEVPAPTSTTPGEPARPTSGRPAEKPFRFMFVFWGIPLVLFIVVAVIKQCGGGA